MRASHCVGGRTAGPAGGREGAQGRGPPPPAPLRRLWAVALPRVGPQQRQQALCSWPYPSAPNGREHIIGALVNTCCSVDLRKFS